MLLLNQAKFILTTYYTTQLFWPKVPNCTVSLKNLPKAKLSRGTRATLLSYGRTSINFEENLKFVTYLCTTSSCAILCRFKKKKVSSAYSVSNSVELCGIRIGTFSNTYNLYMLIAQVSFMFTM